jgi:hypothetical protein
MSFQSESDRLRGLFDAALQHYEKTTNIILAKHPLAEQLQNCHTIESTTKFLQDKVREFGDFRESDKIMASIKNTVSGLSILSVNAASDSARDLVRPDQFTGVSPPLMVIDHLQSFPPAKAIQSGLAIMIVVCNLHKFLYSIPSHIQVLQAAKGMKPNYEELVDLLESIEHLLKPLDVYTQIPPTPAMDEMVVKIMAELLSTLALTTKELKQGRSSECVLAGVLRDSVQRSKISKEDYWKKEYRSGPTKTSSTIPN